MNTQADDIDRRPRMYWGFCVCVCICVVFLIFPLTCSPIVVVLLTEVIQEHHHAPLPYLILKSVYCRLIADGMGLFFKELRPDR